MKATRQELENLGADIIINAYEEGTYGLASWAVCDGTYAWGSENGAWTDGDKNYASVTIYEQGDEAKPNMEKPLMISQSVIADFIQALATDKVEFTGNEYGELSKRTMYLLKGAYLLGKEGIEEFQAHDDAYVSDSICQTVLLGEVRYG